MDTPKRYKSKKAGINVSLLAKTQWDSQHPGKRAIPIKLALARKTLPGSTWMRSQFIYKTKIAKAAESLEISQITLHNYLVHCYKGQNITMFNSGISTILYYNTMETQSKNACLHAFNQCIYQKHFKWKH